MRAITRKLKQMLSTTTALVAGVVLLLSLSVGTLAWYGGQKKLELPVGEGSVAYVSRYFESGNGSTTAQITARYDANGEWIAGTKPDGTTEFTEGEFRSPATPAAYEIKTPDQLYNLAWLQYLGYFNDKVRDSESSQEVLTQTHFYLSMDLDMTGYTLPPIGTVENPFIGTFDGNGHTISNLRVSNTRATMASGVSQMPLQAQEELGEDLEGTYLMGLFGVVGSYDGAEAAQEIAVIKNVNINGITVSYSGSEQTLLGYAAGYVNGKLERVSVSGQNTLSADAGASAVEGVTENLSDYALVGHAEPAYLGTVEVETVALAWPVAAAERVDTENSGDVWGGSINMVDMHARLLNVYNNVGSSDDTALKYYDTQSYVINEATGQIIESHTPLVNPSGTTPKTGYSDMIGNDTTGTLQSYPSTVVGGEQGTAGNYALYPNPSSTNQFVGILGRPTNLPGSPATQVIRLLNAYRTTYYIKDGDAYLNIASNSIDYGNCNMRDMWIIENGQIYTINENYDYCYLTNSNGSLGVSYSSVSSSGWSYSSAEGVVNTLNGVVYRLHYMDGAWHLLTTLRECRITDGNGNYLNLSTENQAIVAGIDESTATIWRWDTAAKTVYTNVDGVIYYLGIDQNAAVVAVTGSLVPHLDYSAAEGFHSVVIADDSAVTNSPTNGTLRITDQYTLVNGDLEDGASYAIVSATESNGQYGFLSHGTGTQADTELISADVSGSSLNLQGGTAVPLWKAVAAETGFQIAEEGSESTMYLSLMNPNHNAMNLASEGTVLTVAGGGDKTISYYYEDYSSRALQYSADGNYSDAVGKYYLVNGSYEQITEVSCRWNWNWNLFTYYYNWSIVTTQKPNGHTNNNSSIEIYTKTDAPAYITYDDNTNYFRTSNSSGTVRFYQRGATYADVDTDELGSLYLYARNIVDTCYPGDYSIQSWQALQSAIAAAQAAIAGVTSPTTELSTAQNQQNAVNDAAVALKTAILGLTTAGYHIAYNDDEWVPLVTTDDVALSQAAFLFPVVQPCGQVQMVQKTQVAAGKPSYFPITSVSQTNFDAALANTGYFSSSNVREDYQRDSGGIRVSWFDMRSLSNSLNSNYNAYTTSSNLQILTHTATTEGLFDRIDDDYNNVTDTNTNPGLRGFTAKTPETLGLVKYEEARSKLQTVLLEKRDKVYGVHFMDAVISKDTTFIAPSVTINGETMYNYELPEASIDFKLKEKGYINFFAGSYYTNTGHQNDSFFSLYKIERQHHLDAEQVVDGSVITAIREIFEIYGNPDDPSAPYVYRFADDTTFSAPAGYTRLFDTRWIKDPGLSAATYKCMFYYEIPMNEGEYALGSVEKKFGAYLVYLDISANRQEIHRQRLQEQTTITSSSYTYPLGVQLTESGVYSTAQDSVAVSVPAGAAASVTLSRTDASAALTGNGTARYIGDDMTLTANGGSVPAVPDSQSSVTTYKDTLVEQNETLNQTTATVTTIVKTTEADGTSIYEKTIDGAPASPPVNDSEMLSPAAPAVVYHYVKPGGVTVTNTARVSGWNDAYGFSFDQGYWSTFAMGERKPVTVSAYDLDVAATESITVKQDVLSGISAMMNGSSFVSGSSLPIQPVAAP